MQLNLLAQNVQVDIARRSGTTAPQILSLITPLAGATAPVDGSFEQHLAERKQQRDDNHHEAAAAETPNRSADVLAEAERKMEPGSRAHRRAEMREQMRADANARTDGKSESVAPPRDQQSAKQGAATSEGSRERLSIPFDSKLPRTPASLAPQHGSRQASELAAGTHAGVGTAARVVSTPIVGTNQPAAGAPQAAHELVTQAKGVTASATAAVSATRGASAPAVRSAPAVAAPAVVRQAGAGAPTLRKAAPALQSETSRNDANVARILRSIHARLGRERSVATLRLDPPELGMMRMRMELQQNQLTLTVDTQTSQARRLLTEQLDALRQGLEAAGVRLERVEIRTMEPAPDQTFEQSTQQDAAGQQQASAQPEQGSAGGGRNPGTDAQTRESATDASHASSEEPAAESLVNILA